MEQKTILITQIIGSFLLAIIYYLFLLLYIDYTIPRTEAFTYMALCLALFSFLLAKSKTMHFKIINFLFLLMTLSQLFSYKAGCDTLDKIEHKGCFTENAVLKDFQGEDIFTILKYQYSEDEGKCILRTPQAKLKTIKNGVINGK